MKDLVLKSSSKVLVQTLFEQSESSNETDFRFSLSDPIMFRVPNKKLKKAGYAFALQTNIAREVKYAPL